MITAEEKKALSLIEGNDFPLFEDFRKLIGFADGEKNLADVCRALNPEGKLLSAFVNGWTFLLPEIPGGFDRDFADFIKDNGRDLPCIFIHSFLSVLGDDILMTMYICMYEILFGIEFERLHDMYGVGAESLKTIRDDFIRNIDDSVDLKGDKIVVKFPANRFKS